MRQAAMMIQLTELVAVASVGCLVLMTGCSSVQKKFDQIIPEMTMQEVRQTMSDGPTRLEATADSNYSSWYWDNKYCVLFKGGRVVMKDAAQAGASMNVLGGKYEESRSAQCMTPGQAAKSGMDRTVSFPGLGSVKLPSGKLGDGS